MQKEMLNKLLLSQRDELSERIEKITIDLGNRRKNRIPNQRGIDHTNDDVLVALKNEAQEKLDMTQIAIHHLENGEFGYCVECGNNISDERLKTLPHTQVCRVCAKKEEGSSDSSPLMENNA